MIVSPHHRLCWQLSHYLSLSFRYSLAINELFCFSRSQNTVDEEGEYFGRVYRFLYYFLFQPALTCLVEMCYGNMDHNFKFVVVVASFI